MRTPVLTALALLIGAVIPVTVMAQAKSAPHSAKDAEAACMDMMHPGMSESDKRAMHQFMRSDQAPQIMSKMMAMARQMGDGNVSVGMTKMMHMMESMHSTGGMAGVPSEARRPAVPVPLPRGNDVQSP